VVSDETSNTCCKSTKQNKTSPCCTASGVTRLEERLASCRVSRRHFAVKLFYLWRIGSDNGCVQLLRLAARGSGAKCAGACARPRLFVSTQGPGPGREAYVETFQVLGGLTTARAAGAAASDEAFIKISRTAGSVEEGQGKCMRARTVPPIRSPSKCPARRLKLS
jgi:hypothetical protein